MASRPRTKMDIGERAKQFMPFAALKGLPEALAKMERAVVSRAELSEEMATELDEKLRLVKRGAAITVAYYEGGEYREITGQAARVDMDRRNLQVDDRRILFEDIRDIEV